MYVFTLESPLHRDKCQLNTVMTKHNVYLEMSDIACYGVSADFEENTSIYFAISPIAYPGRPVAATRRNSLAGAATSGDWPSRCKRVAD